MGTIEVLTVLIECLTVLLEYVDLISQSHGIPNFQKGSLYELDRYLPIQTLPCQCHWYKLSIIVHIKTKVAIHGINTYTIQCYMHGFHALIYNLKASSYDQ